MYFRSRADQWLLSIGVTERLEQRVEALTETRNQTLDHAAAELRRIERDLHDGAQARLAGLGMTLGMAAELVERDPGEARRMLTEARETSSAALGDLRDVVHGIHPPVLADRGLKAAIESLALDLVVPVEVSGEVPDGLSAPVESAAYFTVAECLANVAKHARASRAWVELGHPPGLLSVVVGDDGRGGADPGSGTGMRGVARRLAAFDGTMRVSSPTGGPTLVTLEVPCDSSSPRTTPSSETA
jgi:signal transduction histidine kinase